MPPAKRLMNKSPEVKPAKRSKTEDSEAAEETALAVRKSDPAGDDEGSGAMVPVKRGGGRGLKAVQSTKELSKQQDKANGEKVETKQKSKEQKLYTAKSNQHVETKVVDEHKSRKVKKDGSVTVVECTTVKKVCYL
mmetsp:Transcript_70897/g.122854  ORF Transcript_70897/g.122854 Transcript_70897/m.122854 type:complete len:136 (-) Transcript_70897:47-454(-)